MLFGLQSFLRQWYHVPMSDLSLESQKAVTIVYTNWRGETAERTIIPIKIWYGKTEWHPEEQWLLTALDLEKDAERDFAIKDISNWK
jgi:predicted DNA-binding transcriptional regulator YafY